VEIERDDMELHWEAFKFPGAEKTGVKGTLRNLGLKDEYKGKTLAAIFKDLEFNIDTRSVWTRNSMRDAKLVKFFFSNMIGGTIIKGKTLEFKDNKLKVRLTMNSFSKDITMNVVNKDNRFTATGVIDVLDWGMEKSLSAINKACNDLHKGKTWSDVNIKLTLTYENDCD
jgi:polyisoprenoid-binding protein YceI